ncbi:MAG TPA: nucleoside hydrolase [Candidatus Angelobacter sp.]|nr:nucleoside hydrolase [Candidatus Angelobacter sp.]
MDGGIDDALALILALKSPELEVAGITSVSGNVSVEQATINGLRVVELLNRSDVWVAQGLGNPLVRGPIRATSFHGNDGLGDSNLPLPKLRSSEKPALNAILETLDSSKQQSTTIICTGPLTNIAALLTEFPDVKKMIEEVVIMGGAYSVTEYGCGNETPVAEFNIYSDPEAAKILFESGVSVKAVGLDVTMNPRVQLTEKDYVLIGNRKGRVAVFAKSILRNNMRTFGLFALHDPMAVAVKAKPSLFKFANYHTQVETRGEYTLGMTVADRRAWLTEDRLVGTEVEICTSVDSKFKQVFLNRLTAT